MMRDIIEKLMGEVGKVGAERYRKGPAIVIKKEVVEGPKKVEGDELDELLAMLREKKDEEPGVDVKADEDKSEDDMDGFFSEEKSEENWMDKPESLDEVLKERKKRLGRV